jgi:hypothetical protein
MSALGRLVASCVLDTAEFTVGTDKAKYLAASLSTDVDRAMRDMERSATRALGGIAAAAAAGFGIAALKSAFDDLVKFRGELEKMSQITGASVESLSVLGQAAKLAGTDIGTVEAAMVKMTKGLSASNADTKDTALALEYLGVKARDSFGQLRDPGDIMRDVAKKMGVMGEGANKTAIALALWGKSGAQMLPVMKEMFENGDLVAKVTTEQAVQAHQYEMALVRLHTAMDQTKRLILSEMVAPMTALTQVMTQAITSTDSMGASVKALSKSGELRNWAYDVGYALATIADFARVTKDTIMALGSSVSVVAADVVRGTAYMAAAILPFGALIRKVADSWRDAQLEEANRRWAALLDSNTSKIREAYEWQMRLNAALAAAMSGQYADQASRAQQRAERSQTPFRGTDHDTSRRDAFKAENAELEKQIAHLKGVGEMEAYLTKLSEDRFAKITPKQRQELIDKEALIIKLKQEKTTREELLKNDEALLKSQEKTKAQLDDYVISLKAQANQEKFDLDIIGKTRVEQEKAIALRRLDLELKQQLANLPDDELGTSVAIANALREQTEIAKQKIAAYIDAKDALLQEKTVWDEISGKAGTFFANLVVNGKSAFSSLRDQVKSLAAEMLAFFAKRWILQMVVAGGGAGATGASAALNGMASNAAGSLMSGMISGAGTGIGGAFGTGVLTGAGDFVGTGLAGMAGNLALAAGATDAFAATVAAAVPVIGWIVAIAAILYSIFGQAGGGPKGGGSFMGNFDASGNLTGPMRVPNSDNGRFFTPNQSDPQMQALSAATGRGYVDFVRALGGNSSALSFGFGFDTDPNGTAQNRVSSEVRDASGNLIYGVRNREIGRDQNQIGPELQLEASRAMLAALQHSDLPSYLAHVFDGLTASTATQEQINDAIKAATALKTIFDVVTRDPLADLAASTEANSNRFQTALRNNATAIKDAMSHFDHSTASTEHLRDATIAYYNAQLQLISGIDQVKQSVDDLFGGTIRSLEMGGMDKQGQYDFLRNEAATLQQQALASSDPETVRRLAEQINADLNAAFNLLSPEEQNAHRAEFLSGTRSTQAALDARLEALRRQAIEDTKDVLRQIKELIGANTQIETHNAATNLTAANTQLTAAQTPRTLILQSPNGEQQVITLP